MADDMSVDTSELEAFAKSLERFPDALEGEFMDKASSAGANVFLAALVERTPVHVDAPSPGSKSLRPFWLRGDICKWWAKDFQGWIIGPSWATAYVARWVEYGHQLVKGGPLRGGKGKVVGHVAAHPFIRPAFDVAKQEAVDVSKATMGKLVADFWKKEGATWKRSA